MTIEEAVNKTQSHITQMYSSLIEKDCKNDDYNAQQLKSYIKKFITDENITVNDQSGIGIIDTDNLVNIIYQEMTGFSVLDELLGRNDIEEINILSYKDINVNYDNGQMKRYKRHFFSPEHLIDVTKRMLRESGKILDLATPVVVGNLNNRVRITVFCSPIVDKNLGLGASIRIINPKQLKEEDFVRNGTATKEILDFLKYTYKFGVSVCIGGSTGSGKTTIMSFLLSVIDNHKRLITIEQDTREYNLIKYDKDGYMLNNVIHMVTRKSKDEDQNVDQSKLLEIALTSNPDYICVNEMKGEESITAVSSANTGHAVMTTIHTNSCTDMPYRILSLCKLKSDISDSVLMPMLTQAFPIMVYIEKLPDGSRRIQEITETIGIKDGVPQMNTLYRFATDKSVSYEAENDDGEKYTKYEIKGHYEKVNKPSEKIKELYKKNAMLNTDAYKSIFGD